MTRMARATGARLVNNLDLSFQGICSADVKKRQIDLVSWPQSKKQKRWQYKILMRRGSQELVTIRQIPHNVIIMTTHLSTSWR